MADISFTERLQKYEAEYRGGDGDALLSALHLCLNCSDKPAPDWLLNAVAVALVRYSSCQSKTLDEAFQVPRPKGWHAKRARKNALTGVVWQRVVKQHRDGEPIGRALFESVAEELNRDNSDQVHGVKWNGTDVQEAYYAIEQYVRERRES